MRVTKRAARPWIAYAPALPPGSPLPTYQATSAAVSSRNVTRVESTSHRWAFLV